MESLTDVEKVKQGLNRLRFRKQDITELLNPGYDQINELLEQTEQAI